MKHRTYRTLRESLAARQMSQAEFARRCRVSRSYVSLIMHGKRVPPVEMAMLMAAIADVPLEALFQTGRRRGR